ncbi:hypothetical protein B0H11DRAFT_1907983 [Mycena galericulata]|nr:hypothetical protein B0H11DRAFT_1907983 [Mycena galericulata]
MITHFLGGQGKEACPHASSEARADATAQRENGKEKTASKKRAAVSTDLEPPAKKPEAGVARHPLHTFEDPEMKILFGMLRTTAPDIIPPGKVLDFDAEDWGRVNGSRITHPHIYPHGMKGNTNPIAVWAALAYSQHLHELTTFAITILNIAANQAGCECTFSRTKIEQSDHHRNRFGLQKIDKRTKIRMTKIPVNVGALLYPVQRAGEPYSQNGSMMEEVEEQSYWPRRSSRTNSHASGTRLSF